MKILSITLWGLAISLVFQSCMQQQEKVTGPIVELSYEENYTPTYYELISHYEKLDKFSNKAKLFEVGKTDAGKPLHLFVITNDADFSPESNKAKGKSIVFINNGIHPGESCGIDASLKFADEMLRNVNGIQDLLKDVTICIVPVYNVGGMLNRSAYNRANQVGPTETGFRGNARNLDLNRDFLKCDSRNAQSFNAIFTQWNPDVFLDTHTTNGSDHQYSITLIPTNPATLPQPMSQFLRNKMLPALYNGMAQTEYELIPYVMWSNSDPESGITMTLETPRFSTGYSRLHNAYGFMTENHVYKSYTDRVLSVYQFIKELVVFSASNSTEIIQTRADGVHETIESNKQILTWKVDTTKFDIINFKGYKSGVFKSPLTGLMRNGYDRNQPFEKEIKYFTNYTPSETIDKPEFYVLPAAWYQVVDRLKLNQVEMEMLPKDTILEVGAYYITNVSHFERAYNGHYPHTNVEVDLRSIQVQLFAGDFIIPTNQERVSYVVECLEPRASDSFFRWNFFDSMLDRREYFSAWGFEANAKTYFDEHPEFKERWEAECKSNPELKDDHYKQMQYIYSQSEWDEKSYMRYPVYRLDNFR